MTIQRFKWIEPDPIPRNIDLELAEFPPILRQVLFRRGLITKKDAISYLSPQEPGWYPSLQLLHTEKCCQLIRETIQNQGCIAVYGDYDADGITGTALLVTALLKITKNVIYYIPDRIKEGYGLNKNALLSLAEQGVKLLITVDNGIRSLGEVEFGNSLGLKVIITDHHTPKSILPSAAGMLNPKLPDDQYPNKNLSGVGIVYKLISALSSHYPEIIPVDYLDLVSIGTIADIVPLVGENRYLVRQGLKLINQFHRQSIASLLGAANLIPGKITSQDISYQIGPRLNAPGRIGNPATSLELLLSTDLQTSGNLAQILETQNYQRKIISLSMEQRVDNLVAKYDPLPSILFALDSEFHVGIVGITAGYLTKKYYLPSVVGNSGSDQTIASCRSIPEFNIISALDQCKDLFIRYGGHALAAGFTILNNKLPELEERLSNLADECLADLELHPTLSIDAEVSLAQLDETLYITLEDLEPTGSQNPEVSFLTRNLTALQKKAVGQNDNHLKLKVSDGNYTLDAICFGMGDLIKRIPSSFDAVYKFDLNEFRGKRSYQLRIIDIRPA